MRERLDLPDGSSVPDPWDKTDLEWRLRHNRKSITEFDMLVAASFIQMYKSLIVMTLKESNKKINMIRKELKKGGENGNL